MAVYPPILKVVEAYWKVLKDTPKFIGIGILSQRLPLFGAYCRKLMLAMSAKLCAKLPFDKFIAD
jgi:hypothetical protein